LASNRMKDNLVISRVKLLILISVAVIAMLVDIRSARASQLIDEGMRFYNGGQYEKAGSYFEAEIKANPNSATAHYLLGNAFVKLNRTVEAQAAYERASMLDPNGSAGQYSRRAKEALSAQCLRPPSNNVQSPSATPDTVDQEVKASANTVAKQTDEHEKRLLDECTVKVNEITKNSESKIQAVQREMNERTAANGVPMFARNGRKYYDPAIDNEAVRQEYAPQINAIRDEAQKQIDLVKASYKDRMTACENSAVTVDRSYIGQNTGKVKLIPSGTSLYTRNYQNDGEASGDAVPILASPKRLIDAK
jgi:Tetratricopeptide repeat